MPVTPIALRGSRYNTPSFRRCARFRTCEVCGMCAAYNANHHMCVVCESNKPDGTRCPCTDETRAKYRDLCGVLKCEPFEFAEEGVEMKPIPVADNPDWERIADGMGDVFDKIRISPLEIEDTP